MEKEYVDALLKSLEKTYSTDEKFELITAFVTLLSEYQNKSTEGLEKATKTLKLVTENIGIINHTNEQLHERLVHLEGHVNYLYEGGIKTQATLHSLQNDVLDQIEQNGRILEHVSSLYQSIDHLSDRIEKIYDELDAKH